jgi:DNA-binding transcriptional ArsR family regulator
MSKTLSFPDKFVNQACDLFRLLSDKTRLGILLHLVQGEHSVGELCVEMDLPQPTVSHHLALMRMSRLIHKRRQGKQMIYSVNKEMLREMAIELFKYMAPKGNSIEVDQFVFSKVGK